MLMHNMGGAPRQKVAGSPRGGNKQEAELKKRQTMG